VVCAQFIRLYIDQYKSQKKKDRVLVGSNYDFGVDYWSERCSLTFYIKFDNENNDSDEPSCLLNKTAS